MPNLTENPTTGFFTRCIDHHGVYLGNLTHVHSPANCAGRGCAIHAHPSDHMLKDAPMFWREDRGILERTCKHGVGHPDHDSAEYLKSVGQDYENVHGCDGCCMSAEQEVDTPPISSEEQAYFEWRSQRPVSSSSISAKEAFLAGAAYAAGSK